MIAEERLKRLRMRCWRRGTREMDLILGGFADQALADLSETQINGLEALLEENDQDLYSWVTGAAQAPGEHKEIIKEISTILPSQGRS